LATQNLSPVSHPFFGEVLAGCLDQHIQKISRIVLPKLHCCEFEDEFGCGELGVVTEIESEKEYCRKHFKVVAR
jgi:hypothetical protein